MKYYRKFFALVALVLTLAFALAPVLAMAAEAIQGSEAGGVVFKLPGWFKWLLPIISPAIIGLLKTLLPQIREKVPGWSWPFVSMAISMILTALGIGFDPTSLGLAVVAGLAGSKIRDLAVGKPNAV